MNTFAILAIAWIPVAVAIVIAFAFSLSWFEDRAARGTRAIPPNSGETSAGTAPSPGAVGATLSRKRER
jgi:hypothetical protein